VSYVLFEKPIAMNLEEADAIEKSFREAGITVMMAHTFRFLSSLARIKELLQPDGEGPSKFGQPILLQGHYHLFKDYDLYPAWKTNQAESGGGVLMRDGIHVVDAVLNTVDAKVVEVWGKSANVLFDSEVEDTFTGGLTFSNGTLAELSFDSVGKFNGDIGMTVHTQNSTFEATRRGLKVWSEDPDSAAPRLVIRGPDPRPVIDEPIQGDLFSRQMAYFLECVFSETVPNVSTSEGKRVVEVVLALYQAASEGKKLTVCI
jgi:predicted dehydrogenase